jgi:hypothetical protein
MNRVLMVCVTLILGHVLQPAINCQAAPYPPGRLSLFWSATTWSATTRFGTQLDRKVRGAADIAVGEVVNVDKQSSTTTVKTDEGSMLLLMLDANTICLRLPAGVTTIAGAVPVQPGEIGPGDRVLARGSMSEDKKQFRAQRVIILSKADVEKKREHDIDEWRQRGIAGVVKQLTAGAEDIVLETHGLRGVSIVVVTTHRCEFRRYPVGSASFADTVASSFGELKVGDQLRALGTVSTDGKKFNAEAIVSGSFQTIGCLVTEVDTLKGEIKAKTLDQKQPITITLGRGAKLSRISPKTAALIAKAVQGPVPGSPPPPQQGPAGQNRTIASSDQKQADAHGAGQPIDLQRSIDALPGLTLSDIKAGDVLAIAGGMEGHNSHMTAIRLFAGVDAILSALKPPLGKHQTIRLSAGLPVGVFDFSLGPPQ